MDLNDAIHAHANWKMKLFSYLDNPDNSLSSDQISFDQISSDSACELGQWLNGEGRKYSSAPEFAPLESSHARFHKSAGEILNIANSNGEVAPETVLSARNDFANASDEVVEALKAIQSRI